MLLGSFKGLSRFSTKMILRDFHGKVVMYLLTKFGILRHYTIIQLFRRFYLRFLKNLEQNYRKLQLMKNFQGCGSFSEKLVCIRWPDYTFLSLAPILDLFEYWS